MVLMFFVMLSFWILGLLEALLAHFAPNCATFSRAREIPIQGASNAPRPLRSLDHPRGIPGELERRMNKKQRSRLESDTSMADLSAEKCFEALEAGRYFSLEHPEGSLPRELESWKKLSRDPRVLMVKYTTCMFEGSERKKRQILITNVKTLEKHVEKFVADLSSATGPGNGTSGGDHVCLMARSCNSQPGRTRIPLWVLPLHTLRGWRS